MAASSEATLEQEQVEMWLTPGIRSPSGGSYYDAAARSVSTLGWLPNRWNSSLTFPRF